MKRLVVLGLLLAIAAVLFQRYGESIKKTLLTAFHIKKPYALSLTRKQQQMLKDLDVSAEDMDSLLGILSMAKTFAASMVEDTVKQVNGVLDDIQGLSDNGPRKGVGRFYRCHRDMIDLSMAVVGKEFDVADTVRKLQAFPADAAGDCSLASFEFLKDVGSVDALVASMKEQLPMLGVAKLFLPEKLQGLVEELEQQLS